MSELYPESSQIKPMKYGKHPDVEQMIYDLNKSHQYIATLKKDGYSYYIEHTKSGYVYAFSRSVSRKTGELTEKSENIPHIVEWVKNNIPRDTILCGEIYIPYGTSKDVTRIMGALPDKAIARQKLEGYVHYYLFDMIKYAGIDMRDWGFEKRYSALCEHIDLIPHPDFIEVAKSKTGYDTYETILSWIAQGEEGAVIKKKDGCFKENSRPKYNYKMKKETDTLDFVILRLLDPEYYYTGTEPETWPYKDSDGKLITKAAYKKWKNGLEVGAYNKSGALASIGRVASGINDAMCADMTAHPDKYINKVCEIQAMSLDKDALSFRHPFFIKMRPDKPAEDCKIEEIFN